MNDLSITITLTGAGTAHVCGPDCDCPRAIARTQTAIDTARTQDGCEPRPLAERLRSMRNGAPEPEWFDTMAYQAERLQDLLDRERDHVTAQYRTQLAARTASADLPMGPDFVSLWNALEETVDILRMGELLPDDAELVRAGAAGTVSLYSGPYKFQVQFIEAGPVKAAQYHVTTTSEITGEDAWNTERYTIGLDHVRAWCVAFAAQANQEQRRRTA